MATGGAHHSFVMTSPLVFEHSGQLYLRQLLGGRDFARGDGIAEQMANYVYLVGDNNAGKAVVIDCAYNPREVVEIAGADGMTIIGAVVTHYHADHAGGSIGGFAIAGAIDLLNVIDVPVHIQHDELTWMREQTGIADEALVQHESGDTIAVGDLLLETIHTPGHTEGSQCIMIDGRLFTGDTLFLDGCGRTDLPGGDPVALYESLTRRLAPIPNAAPIFPGHAYSPMPSASMGEVRRTNPVLQPLDKERWLARFAN